MSAMEEAVKAVQHAKDCVVSMSFELWAPHKAVTIRACSCDRNARIAKGIEAAIIVALTWHLEPEYLNDRNQVLMAATALAAFKEAAQ